MVGGIVFSRLDSSRLPGKALIDINGRPMLGRVIDRGRLAKGIDQIVIATSKRLIDDPKVEFAIAEGISFYRGEVDDVASRAIHTCYTFGFSNFVRICGDRPFFDPDIISQLIVMHTQDVDLSTTTFPPAYPPGLTAEVIKREALERVLRLTSSGIDREHLTRYLYDNPHLFKIINLPAPPAYDFSGINLTVDTARDLDRARAIALEIDKVGASSGDMDLVLSLARAWELRNPISNYPNT